VRRRSDHKEISPLRFDFSGKPHFVAGENTKKNTNPQREKVTSS